MLATEHAESHRQAILAAFRAALDAADPCVAVQRYCRLADGRLWIGHEALDLNAFDEIWVVGAGKASPALAAGLVTVLGDRITGGTVVTKDGYGRSVARVNVREAGHPIPDARGMAAAREALRVARDRGRNDLLVCLLSGGASALWTLPPRGISLGDVRRLTLALLRSGAPIRDLNTVRKHLSRLAGGGLAEVTPAGRVVTIAISDVVGAPIDVIGSGPTLPDDTSRRDALRVLNEWGVEMPDSIATFLEGSRDVTVPGGVRIDERAPIHGSFHVVASVSEAVDAAVRSLSAAGYAARAVDRAITGEARDVAAEAVSVARRALAESATATALVWGGETTVTVTGPGQGGRNQELALAAAVMLRPDEPITIAAAATDGSDGTTDAAGGFADGATVVRAAAMGFDARAALHRNDSHTFLGAAGDLIVTGPTGTNVNDLVFALVGRPRPADA